MRRMFPNPLLRGALFVCFCATVAGTTGAQIHIDTKQAAGPVEEPARSSRPNVVVLVLDQLRADELHCYGNSRQDSPNIDRLAQRGVRFSHFYTVAPWTSPSFASLHTSLFPSRHGVTLFWKPGMPLIDKETPMLTPDFKYHGYYTAAWVNNRNAGKDLTGRGFDEYHEPAEIAKNITEIVNLSHNLYSGPATASAVSSWLGQHRSQPFFLYVHFVEPHSPYNPPPQYDVFKSDAYPYMHFTGLPIGQGGALLRFAMVGDKNAIERLYQLYDGKILFIDHYVGEILNQLKTLGLDRNTIILLTSDHGELLYSHPKDFLTFDHRSLYNTDLHIPLIIAGPGIPQGKVVSALGSNVDTAPTLLNLAGLPDLPDAEGHSLVPLIDGKTTSINRYVYSEEDVVVPLRAIRSMRYKLILNLWSGKEQLFDLERDPAERTDIVKQNPAVVKDLDGHLRKWIQENTPARAIQIRRWRIFTAPEQSVTLDDQVKGADFQMTGTGWKSDTALRSGNFDVGCFWTGNGDGNSTAVWRNDSPMLGTYQVFLYYGHPAIGKLATNAPFTIVTDSGSKMIRVNFNQGAGQWRLLATVKNPRYVEETNAADGAIIADAVRFDRIAP